MQMPPRKPPSYEISDEFPCQKCSKATVSTTWDAPYYYVRFTCPVNQYCPFVVQCEHFSREPGVD